MKNLHWIPVVGIGLVLVGIGLVMVGRSSKEVACFAYNRMNTCFLLALWRVRRHQLQHQAWHLHRHLHRRVFCRWRCRCRCRRPLCRHRLHTHSVKQKQQLVVNTIMPVAASPIPSFVASSRTLARGSERNGYMEFIILHLYFVFARARTHTHTHTHTS